MGPIITESLKWILIVLIAGFIGYFGKYAAKVIIAKFSKKEKTQNKQESKIQKPISEKEKKYRYKIEKKRLKSEKKKNKS